MLRYFTIAVVLMLVVNQAFAAMETPDDPSAVLDMLFGFRTEAPTTLVEGDGDIGDVDTLAQVLNYSSFGKDKGLHFVGGQLRKDLPKEPASTNSWVKVGQCRYAKLQFEDAKGPKIAAEEFLNGTSAPSKAQALGRFFGVIDQIDFNRLDPRNISFSDQGRAVLHEGRVLIASAAGPLDVNRLHRGWTLIYDEYCKGARKAF